jgi:transposase
MDARMTNDTLAAIPRAFKHVIAFEVSKAELVVQSFPDGSAFRIPNARAAITKAIRRELVRNAKLDLGPLLVVCEATGSYDRQIVDAAHALGVAMHRAHGSRVRAFARFKGRLAKSDDIDVGVIGAYALASQNLVLQTAQSAEQKRLRALMDRRDEVGDLIEAERCRLEHVGEADIKRMITAHIRALETQKRQLEKALAALVDADERLARASTLMRSVKGVGTLTPFALLAYLPEIGTVSRETIAALAGLAPFDRDSGSATGRRHVAAGRAQARRALYMPATVAIRHNVHLKAMFERLIARGRPFKAAITAVMRKLLVILNAVVASGQPCQLRNAAR